MNQANIKKNTLLIPIKLFCLFLVLLMSACTFDYGIGEAEEPRPDVVMENLEYVRVRGGNLLARFHAEYAERWENRQVMELRTFAFEQMEDQGETVSVTGTAGAAIVYLDSGDIIFSGGVRINMESEDIIISTYGIEWRDRERTLTGSFDDEVEVERSDGTSFTGRGIFADIRSRTWSFSGEVHGVYVDDDNDEEENQ